MAQDATSTAAARDRDLRLQSAKKKLKSYRAKQAQMEKAKRQSAAIMASSASSSSALNVAQLSSPSVSPTRLLGGVINDAFNESQIAMMGGESKRNSARLSASFNKRHSRGLSRSGVGHGRGHSRTGSISLSQTALSNGVVAAALEHLVQKGSISLSAPRPVSTHLANTAHSHTRGHSRSGSRSLAASKPRSRPTSMVGGPALDTGREEGGANDSWRDEEPASVEDLFKTPTMNSVLGDMSRFETPTQAVPPAVSLTMATPTTSAPAPTHARRPSRHSRKGSVSTRRESMEIMGGLANYEPNSSSNRHSRRISSSTHRWSGLQTASVLFGGEPDYIPYERKREHTDGDKSDDEGGDRQTALEKLEGRRQRTTSLQSSVQLPSFDDVHGEEGMDKRASLHLLEANAQTTSSEKPPATIVPASPRPLTLMETGKDLGILVEEEEEDEESGILSPIKERSALDFTTEEEKRRRKLAEQEVIKRNRRGSLTPRPLKLKSRPASLFVAPRPTGFPSSQSLPTLTDMAEEKPLSASSVTVPAPRKDDSGPLRPQEEAAAVAPNMSASSRSVPLSAIVTPSKETKRAWRASMPAAKMSPAGMQSPAQSIGSPSALSSGGARQGMRALRLGGAGNFSFSSSASTGQRQQHKNHSDSMSSMTSTTSGSSMPLSKRGSLLYSTTPPSTNVSAMRDDAPAMAKKRGSLIYKTSPLDAATMSQLSTSASSPSPSRSSSSSLSTGGVPMGMYEELKARHQREVGLLDEARNKIARLESEAAAESERRANQVAELEQWSGEEKKALGLRIEHLEASIAQVVEVRQAKENSLAEEKEQVEMQLTQLTTQFEDVEAERDMLRDDVEGWRSRCGDLEKSLRIERQTTDELRMAKGAGKDRIRELLQKLHENDIAVERSSVDEEELSAELKAVLRSPAMGPASPMLGGTAQRGGATSPIFGDHFQMPPSQAVQLLREMRQQIFNLAGSLDHERKQHMLARQDAEEARANVSRLSSMLGDESKQSMGTEVSLSPDRSSMMSSAPTPSTSTPPQTRTKRNHVFAYDSSMESRTGTNSTGSGSAITYQTSHHDEDEESKSKEDDALIPHVPTELVGLGVGTLGTLPEEEELTESSHRAASPAVRESFDLESGHRYSDGDSMAPPTPSLEHTRDFADTRSMSGLHLSSSQDGAPAHVGANSSSVSSAESHGPPSPVSHGMTAGTSASSQDTVLPPTEAAVEEEEEEDPSPMLESRPEFIREWSFEKATAKINRPRVSSTRPKRPTVITNNLLSTRRKNRKISIDDFFGIMSLDENESLPPLPTPSEALEMPPLFIETDYQTAMNRQIGYGMQPRYPAQIRPPVPRTSAVYSRSSNSDRSSTSSRGSSTYNRPASQARDSSFQSSVGMDSGASLAPGGGMLSRVASLTSAFGGYLLGSSAPSTNEQGYVNGNDNIGWSVTRREEEMA